MRNESKQLGLQKRHTYKNKDTFATLRRVLLVLEKSLGKLQLLGQEEAALRGTAEYLGWKVGNLLPSSSRF